MAGAGRDPVSVGRPGSFTHYHDTADDHYHTHAEIPRYGIFVWHFIAELVWTASSYTPAFLRLMALPQTRMEFGPSLYASSSIPDIDKVDS